MFNFDPPRPRPSDGRRDVAVAPTLPPVQQPVAPLPGDDDFPVVPLPPIVPDQPVAPLPPDMGYPVVPLPPIVPDQPPVAPLPPDMGYPVVPLPPIVPDQSPVAPLPGFAVVRFLNAAYGFEGLRVYIGRLMAARNLEYGDLSASYGVLDGFRTVVIVNAASPNQILYQASVPFNAGERVTLAIVRTVGGVDLVRVPDVPCQNRQRNLACVRVVNLVANSPALDVVLSDGRVVFTDVRYKETTPYRQARPKDYEMFVAQTSYAVSPIFSDFQTIEDLPIILANYVLPGYGPVTPLTSFYFTARPRSLNTIFLLGTWSTNPVVLTKIVEDF